MIREKFYIRTIILFVTSIIIVKPVFCQTVYGIKESQFSDTIVDSICEKCIIKRETKNKSGKIVSEKLIYMNEGGKRDSVIHDSYLSFSKDNYVYSNDTTHVYRDGILRASFTINSRNEKVKIEYLNGMPVTIRIIVAKKSKIKRVKYYDYETKVLRKSVRFLRRFNGKYIEKAKSYDGSNNAYKWIYMTSKNSLAIYDSNGQLHYSSIYLDNIVIKYFWKLNTVRYYHFQEGSLKSVYSFKNGELIGTQDYKVLEKF